MGECIRSVFQNIHRSATPHEAGAHFLPRACGATERHDLPPFPHPCHLVCVALRIYKRECYRLCFQVCIHGVAFRWRVVGLAV
jgi:hypothetical protein